MHKARGARAGLPIFVLRGQQQVLELVPVLVVELVCVKVIRQLLLIYLVVLIQLLML